MEVKGEYRTIMHDAAYATQGDAFLKFFAAFFAFGKFPYAREGKLHLTLVLLVCNKFLCSQMLSHPHDLVSVPPD